MRHYLLSLFAAVFFAASLSPANAQVPRVFSYQGVVLDAAGKFIPDGPHNILIKLYDAFDAPNPIYTENQTGIVFIKGIFNVMIGSVTSIPNGVAFDKGYFLGVSVDGGAEMNPRTAISPAPYSLHAVAADVASGLTANATGAVTSVNGAQGALTLQQGNGTVITKTGSIITISSTGVGGTGIQGVQNSDASIAVTNATGPTASISVAPAGITNAKIADAAVTAAKIDASGITSGYVLSATGTGGTSWIAPLGGGLALPFLGSVANAATAFSVVNSGLGGAGLFTVANAASTAFALWGSSNGTAGSVGIYGQNTGSGRGGYFEVTNAANSAVALTGNTQGLGGAGVISIVNTNNSSIALDAVTTGTGRAALIHISNTLSSANALDARTNGTGGAGYFEVTNFSPTVPALEVKTSSTDPSTIGFLSLISNSTTGASNVATAVKGEHDGTNGIGIGVWGLHHGTGVGVLGQVSGNGGYGIGAIGLGDNSIPFIADYQGSSSSGTAVEIKNGFIKVSGTNRTAYVHTTNAGNIVNNRTVLSYPGMSPTDIVIVTHNSVAVRLNNGYGVAWNLPNWEIFLENNPAGVMPAGEKFNVLVIRQ